MVLPMGPWGGGGATFYQIPNSLLFRGTQSFSRIQTGSGATKAIFFLWMRRATLSTRQYILAFGALGSDDVVRFDSGSDALEFYGAGQTAWNLKTTTVMRDTTAWYPVLISYDSTQAIAADRIWIYLPVGGVFQKVTSFVTAAYPALNQTMRFSHASYTAYFGSSSSGNNLVGQISETLLIEGKSLQANDYSISSFIEQDTASQNWRPKKVSGITWGANGCYLGKPWNFSSIGTDYSGQGNNWTPSNFISSDVLSDSPTNVYATINTLATWNGKSSGQPTISNGNLSFSGSGSWWGEMYSTLPVSSGKWYWEVHYSTAPSVAYTGVGVRTVGSIATTTDAGTANNAWFYRQDGQQSKNGVTSALGGTITNGCVMGLAFDADAGTLAIYKDNVLQGTITGIPSGTYATLAHSYNAVGSYKFGQSGFAYTEPSGFKSVSTANLPATIGATSGNFTGNANSDGPFIYTGAVPETLTINSNAVTWGTHADKLATGFKLRTSSSSYNSTSTNNWTATYSTPQKPTVGSNKVPSNAQGNP